jgi:hypothetical protein
MYNLDVEYSLAVYSLNVAISHHISVHLLIYAYLLSLLSIVEKDREMR